MSVMSWVMIISPPISPAVLRQGPICTRIQADPPPGRSNWTRSALSAAPARHCSYSEAQRSRAAGLMSNRLLPMTS